MASDSLAQRLDTDAGFTRLHCRTAKPPVAVPLRGWYRLPAGFVRQQFQASALQLGDVCALSSSEK